MTSLIWRPKSGRRTRFFFFSFLEPLHLLIRLGSAAGCLLSRWLPVEIFFSIFYFFLFFLPTTKPFFLCPVCVRRISSEAIFGEDPSFSCYCSLPLLFLTFASKKKKVWLSLICLLFLFFFYNFFYLPLVCFYSISEHLNEIRCNCGIKAPPPFEVKKKKRPTVGTLLFYIHSFLLSSFYQFVHLPGLRWLLFSTTTTTYYYYLLRFQSSLLRLHYDYTTTTTIPLLLLTSTSTSTLLLLLLQYRYIVTSSFIVIVGSITGPSPGADGVSSVRQAWVHSPDRRWLIPTSTPPMVNSFWLSSDY